VQRTEMLPVLQLLEQHVQVGVQRALCIYRTESSPGQPADTLWPELKTNRTCKRCRLEQTKAGFNVPGRTGVCMQTLRHDGSILSPRL